MPNIDKLQPKYDIVFRRLFGDEKNTRLLISQLNSLLGWPPGCRVRDLTLLPTQRQSDNAEDKDSVLDIRAVDEGGKLFDVEVQVSVHPAYVQRLLYYWARLYSSQLARGMPYKDLRPTISIHILDWSLLLADDRYHYLFKLREMKTGSVLTDYIQLHILELCEFHKGLDELLNNEEKWLHFIQNGHKLTAEQAARLGLPEIVEAEERLKLLSQEQILRMQYEQRFKAEMDKAALKKDWIEEGIEQGIKQGMERGTVVGAARSLLSVLEERGIPVPDEVRERIMQCDDPDLLDRWLRRAMTGQTAEAVIAEP